MSNTERLKLQVSIKQMLLQGPSLSCKKARERVPPYIIQARCELPVTDNSPSEKTVTSWICTSNSAAEMNAKYALALILALQVSMSLCDGPAEPSPELVAKYEDMKAVFYKRVLNAYGKFQAALAPYVEDASRAEITQGARERVEALQSNPHVQTAVKIAGSVVQETGPLVDIARTRMLGVYERNLRPHIGEKLSTLIDDIKVYLNKYLPTE